MKQIISALFLCMLLSAVPGLQAQNIQLHYDFGRSLYDKDLQGRPLLTSTVEKFHPDTWGSTYFFVDMDYTSEGVAAAYWEIAREVKFWKGPFSAHLNITVDYPKVCLIKMLIWQEPRIPLIMLLFPKASH